MATAALLLCFVVATMLVSVILGRSDGGGDRAPGPEPVPGVGATTHQVGSLAEWNAAVSAAAPGDVIRLTSTIDARLVYRGDNDGSTGSGGDGTAAAPIVITAAPGVWIDPGNQNSGAGALDVVAADHIHVVGVRVRNAQFGIRCLQCRGAAGAPVRIAGNVVTSTGHAGIHFGGHWDTHAPSRHGLIEGNTVTSTGSSIARYGEGIYLGHGSVEWVDVTSDVVIRNNDISLTGAEGIDVKPGTRNITISGNRIHDLAPIDGGAISAHYVNHTPNPHPYQLDQVRIEGNLIWNVNLGGVSGSNDWAIWVGHGGVDIIGNRIWGLRNDSSKARAVRIRATQSFGPHPIRIEDNTFWTARGWVAEGTPSGAANVVASGNRGVEATSAEIVVGAGAFVGPAPPLGVASSADNGGGPGSALSMAGGSTPPPDLTPAPTTTTVLNAAPAPTTPPAPAPTSWPDPTTAPSAAPTDSTGSGGAAPGTDGPAEVAADVAAASGATAGPTGPGSTTSPPPGASGDGGTTTVVTAEADRGGPATLAFAPGAAAGPGGQEQALLPASDRLPAGHRPPATGGGVAIVLTLLTVASLLAVRAAATTPPPT
ncbi:MAG: hypothetical protein ACFCVK_10615 [Acidimicrobiales bacterium]